MALTHAGSPARAAPSGLRHTGDTAAHQPPGGTGTARSGGDTQSPRRPVHSYRGDSPHSRRSQNVPPVGRNCGQPLPWPRSPCPAPAALPGNGRTAARPHPSCTGTGHCGGHRLLSHMGSSRTLQRRGSEAVPSPLQPLRPSLLTPASCRVLMPSVTHSRLTWTLPSSPCRARGTCGLWAQGGEHAPAPLPPEDTPRLRVQLPGSSALP